ncbi:MAG: calcineurin-like phosphoesterase family protein [Chthonomonas sp.]|nr:calcineurin-like phosphoesterase family protein [Chthonomonas sp.]
MHLIDRRSFLRTTALGAAGIALAPLLKARVFTVGQEGQQFAEGYVFHDKDGSGKKNGNPGIGGVCVSNGVDVVRTDRDGKWRLPVKEGSVIFVVKPTGWGPPVDECQLPQFYYIHKPSGSPKFRFPASEPTGPLPSSIDFPLKKQHEESKFRMVLFGDTQPRNQREIDYMAHDVIAQVAREAQEVGAVFGLNLGDELFDDLSLFGSLNRTIAQIGIPWYNVVGNHDLNYDAPSNELSTETYQKHYGPVCFAWEYAKVHFIAINDVMWHGLAGGYHGEIPKAQLEFVKNYLQFVPKDRLVVIALHIPLDDCKNAADLFHLIDDRPHTLSLSAHTHVMEQMFFDDKSGWRGKEPHHHLNHATVCGCWWGGNPDERGIPHATMSDGVPNGYSIMEFEGTKYRQHFRAASRPEDEQMLIWMPDEVSITAVRQTEVVVNVYAGSSRSEVKMRIDNGDWTKMAATVREDPHYARLKQSEAGKTPAPGFNRLPNPTKSNHVWVGNLPRLGVGTHRVEVLTRDMYGQEFTQSRLVRVV